jgi:type IX secretion system PorP/SprF family membrane protein
MKTLKYIMILTALVITNAYAQLNPMGSTYFQNQYLANPALAGIDGGLKIDAGYKVQWTAIEGAPSMQAVTATFGTNNKKIGLGLNIYNETAGVILRTAIKGTYAYHLPLNDQYSFLDFGVSGGFMNEWIDYEKVVGDLSDRSLTQFNKRKWYVDGDFGASYRNQRLTVQASIPNLKRFLNRDFTSNIIDRSLFMGSLSHTFISHGFSLEPKLMYRGIENYRDILDIGAQVNCSEDKLMFNAIYHSTNSFTVGVGTWYQKQLRILCLYTTDTSDLQKYSNGEFEIALQYQLKYSLNYKEGFFTGKPSR